MKTLKQKNCGIYKIKVHRFYHMMELVKNNFLLKKRYIEIKSDKDKFLLKKYFPIKVIAFFHFIFGG